MKSKHKMTNGKTFQVLAKPLSSGVTLGKSLNLLSSAVVKTELNNPLRALGKLKPVYEPKRV